jgi:protein-tyrosine phosphatase
MNTIWSYAKTIGNYTLVPFKVGMDKGHEILINLTNTESTEECQKVERLKSGNFIYDHTIAILPPTEVHPNLFLGSSYNAAMLHSLRARNIKYIINVTNEISNYYPSNMTYYNISISDNGKDSILQHLEESYDIIESFLNKNDGAVLVHCYMGASRSASIVTYYIAKKTGKSIEEVVNDLQTQRTNVNMSKSLYNELKSTERNSDVYA